MPTQWQLAVLERVTVELGSARAHLQSLDNEIEDIAEGTMHKSLMRKLRNIKYGEVRRIEERYRDVKNQFDLCFTFDCHNPIDYSAYCDDHQSFQGRKEPT